MHLVRLVTVATAAPAQLNKTENLALKTSTCTQYADTIEVELLGCKSILSFVLHCRAGIVQKQLTSYWQRVFCAMHHRLLGSSLLLTPAVFIEDRATNVEDLTR